jgi:hypothetical protein
MIISSLVGMDVFKGYTAKVFGNTVVNNFVQGKVEAVSVSAQESAGLVEWLHLKLWEFWDAIVEHLCIAVTNYNNKANIIPINDEMMVLKINLFVW